MTGGIDMRVAVTYEDGQIFQHFGHTKQFKVYEVMEGKIMGSSIINAGGSGHGALVGYLMVLGVDVLICGGIGPGAQNALSQIGMKLCADVSGDADEAVIALATGKLECQEGATCDHHHDEHHSCGDHHGEGGCHGHDEDGHEGGCGHHGGGCCH